MSESEPNREALRPETIKLVEGLMAYLDEYHVPKWDAEITAQYEKLLGPIPEEKWVDQLSTDELIDLYERLKDFAQRHGIEPEEISKDRLQKYALLEDNKIQPLATNMNDAFEEVLQDEGVFSEDLEAKGKKKPN
jgi:hypothetical protein